ncbi:MAG: reverse transcriptase/maturase family protein [Bryobacteraceae bacterium]|nr:reverse transcriptase/maturase family protein [Bryobacteraceae bacterium]
MIRVGGLWPQITAFENLMEAARAAARGKRKRPDVARFLLNLEPELHTLRQQLLDGTYTPGEYRTFMIYEPKPRLISAAPFRDRVVHHALTRVLEPVFERRFTDDSFACRKGFGTHAAIARARHACARYPYVLKCDIRKYFPAIDHAILQEVLAHTVKCRPTLDLAAKIIAGSNPQAEVIAYFPGDDLFTPYERRRGLPLGNQTSQFFANVYLNPLDHYIRRELRPLEYIRYCDDFLVFAESKRDLREARAAIVGFLCGLRLEIHSGKSRIYHAADGVTFLGWRIFPTRTRLVRGNVMRFRQRMGILQRRFSSGRIGWQDVRTSVRAWIAHAATGDTWRLRQHLLVSYKFSQRSAVLTGVARRVVEQSTT